MKSNYIPEYAQWIIKVMWISLMSMCTIIAKGETYEFSFSSDEFIIEKTNGLAHVRGSIEYSNVPDPSWPDIPTKVLSIVCPNGKDIASCKQSGHLKIIESNCPVAQRGEEIPTSELGDTSIPSQESLVSITRGVTILDGISGKDGYGIKQILIHPIVYDAGRKDIYVVESLKIDIEWEDTSRWEIKPRPKNSETSLPECCEMNPANLATYDSNNSSTYIMWPGSYIPDTEYLIITNKNLESEFEELAKWRTATGIKAEVVTMESLKLKSDSPTAYKELKRYLYNRYQDGVRYVLFAGSTDIIPTVKCYAEVGKYAAHIPCDWFYGAFDNDFYWDANENGIIGELEDNVDYIPELVVSRLPISTAEEAKKYIQKLYISEWGGFRGKTNPRLLMAGYKLNKDNDKNGLSDVHDHGKGIYEDFLKPYWPYDIAYLFDTGDFPNITFNASGFTSQINYQPDYVYVNTHGGITSWAGDGEYIYSSITKSLTNSTFPFHGYSTACHTSNFTNTECLGEALTKCSGGAIDYIGNSHYGWSNSDGSRYGTSETSIGYILKDIYSHNENLQSKTTSSGIALKNFKVNFSPIGRKASFRWSYFSLNLIGDPLVRAYVGGDLNYAGNAPIVPRIYEDENSVTVDISETYPREFLIIHTYYEGGELKVRHYWNMRSVILPKYDSYCICVDQKNRRPFIHKQNFKLIF